MHEQQADPPRFEDITEATGVAFTREAAGMMGTRYGMAARHAAGQRVLELGCGTGPGFGMLERAGARQVIGGDYSLPLLRRAHCHYGDRVPLIRLSAEDLPLRSGSMDLVLFYEATYYIPAMERAFDEVTRVLSPSGTLLIVSANPERHDFIPSPHSTYYHTATEFRCSLERRGFRVSVAGGFPVTPPNAGPATRLASLGLRAARSALRRLGLVPKTLKGRARLKRLLYRRMIAVPAELSDDFGLRAPLHELCNGPVLHYKIIYVAGRRHNAEAG